MEQAISSDLIRGHIDTIILHALLNSDKFAQQISDSIEEKSNGEYKMIQATLYSSLKRLESLKYVSSYWNDSGEANGRRKFFKITELGKNTVKSNLDNWSFSRALIDRLVDCTPEPIYQTQYVEKIVEVPVPAQISALVSSSTIKTEESAQPAQSLHNENFRKNDKISVSEQNSQEVNFRNILNGLIKTTQLNKQEKITELEPVVKTQLDNNEKLKFNETISSVDYNAHKTQNNGKIDFGDLLIKAAQEGYKVRISSKDSSVSKGKLLINKLNLCASLAVYLVFLIEFLLVSLFAKSVINFSALSIVIIICLATIFPITLMVLFLKKPSKRINKVICADIILTVSIIVFNLLLITFAGNLIFGVDFSNTFELLVYLVMPMIVYIDILLYFVIKYYLSKTKYFKID